MKLLPCASLLVLAMGCAPHVTGVGAEGSGGTPGSMGTMGGMGATCDMADAGPAPGCACAPDQVCDSGGRCLTVIATGQAVGGLALHDATLYWTTSSDATPWSGTVMKCAAAGCNQQPATLATGQSSPGPIVADGASVYWINGSQGSSYDGSLMRCGVSGCSPSPTMLLAGGIAPGGLALNGSHLFWTTWGSSPLEDSGSVWSCPVSGCTPAKVVDVPAYAVVFAATDTTLLGGLGGATNADWVCSPGACAPATLAMPGGSATMDATSAYYTEEGSIRACALGGCGGAPTTLVDGTEGTGPIATDGVNVYFARVSMDPTYGVVGALFKCGVGGCGDAPTTVASLPCASAPANIVLDATHVYWADLAAQMVLKAPK